MTYPFEDIKETVATAAAVFQVQFFSHMPQVTIYSLRQLEKKKKKKIF